MLGPNRDVSVKYTPDFEDQALKAEWGHVSLIILILITSPSNIFKLFCYKRAMIKINFTCFSFFTSTGKFEITNVSCPSAMLLGSL